MQHHILSSAWCLMLKTMQLMIWWAKDGFSQMSPLSKVTPLSKEVVQDLLDSQVLHGDAPKLGNTSVCRSLRFLCGITAGTAFGMKTKRLWVCPALIYGQWGSVAECPRLCNPPPWQSLPEMASCFSHWFV